MKIANKYLMVAILLTFSIGLFSCHDDKKTKKAVVKPVKTMLIQPAKDKAIRSFPGKVLPFKEATLSFLVPGQVVQFPVLEGDAVKVNQLIAHLDPTRYKHEVAEMNAKYLRNKANYERAQKLIKGAFISRSDYDARKAAFDVAKANLGTAKKKLRDTTIYAPFNGIIAKKYVENYEHVRTKQPVAEINDLTKLDVEIFVPENIMINIKEGHAQNTVAIFEAVPGKQYPLTLKELTTKADPDTQTYRVRLTMSAPKDFNILPGMTVTVKTDIPDYQSGANEYYTIPASAVFVDATNQPNVWLVNSNMTVQKTPVKVTRLTGKSIHVLSGLKPGDRIVTAGVHFLKEGEKIKLLTPNTGE